MPSERSVHVSCCTILEGKFGGNDERDSTLNQLLVEMDGFSKKSNAVVFAATNKKEIVH